MFKELSHKRKFILVVVVILLLFLAVYKKTYRPLFQIQNQLAQSEINANNGVNPQQTIFNLQNELFVLNKVIGGTENHTLIQKQILEFITQHSSKSTSVYKISDTHKYSDVAKKITTYTNKVQLKGKYEDLLKLMYTIEKEFTASKIVSANFFSKKNYRTNRTELFLELYFQNYGK